MGNETHEKDENLNAKNQLDCTSYCNLCYRHVILSHTKVSSSSPLPVQIRNVNLLVPIQHQSHSIASILNSFGFQNTASLHLFVVLVGWFHARVVKTYITSRIFEAQRVKATERRTTLYFDYNFQFHCYSLVYMYREINSRYINMWHIINCVYIIKFAELRKRMNLTMVWKMSLFFASIATQDKL